MPLAKTVMIQGTASSVGKSILVTALCRIFQQDGLKVAPFKSQNMALNSYVTPDGGEIGRAQAVQADAARTLATVEMNPILLKPEGEAKSQVVVLGKPIGSMPAIDYHAHKPELKKIIAESLAKLRETYDVIVIEGAGSPAEINLKDREIVNMHVAKVAEAPVLLVGDIDRGGVFAALVGTLELLDAEERAKIRGFIINRFRGDVRLLQSGLEFLEQRTGVPVLGVVRHLERLRIADEDSVSLNDRAKRGHASANEVEIAVIRLPRISNYDDFEPLECEPGVVVRFVEEPSELMRADLVIVPGTKATISDLEWLKNTELAAALVTRARQGGKTLGICGGCQILGGTITDPECVESSTTSARGLELLDLATAFERVKTTARVTARYRHASFFGAEIRAESLSGYEIHMGRVAVAPGHAAFEVQRAGTNSERTLDGAVSEAGNVVGTMIHGLFENEGLRRALIQSLRQAKGLDPLDVPPLASRHEAYDRLAAEVRGALDMAKVREIIGL